MSTKQICASQILFFPLHFVDKQLINKVLKFAWKFQVLIWQNQKLSNQKSDARNVKNKDFMSFLRMGIQWSKLHDIWNLITMELSQLLFQNVELRVAPGRENKRIK